MQLLLTVVCCRRCRWSVAAQCGRGAACSRNLARGHGGRGQARLLPVGAAMPPRCHGRAWRGEPRKQCGRADANDAVHRGRKRPILPRSLDMHSLDMHSQALTATLLLCGSQLAQAYEVVQRQSTTPKVEPGHAGYGAGDPSDLLFRAAGRAAPRLSAQLWEYTCGFAACVQRL